MAEGKKFSTATIAALVVAVVGLILVIVGLSIDWVSVSAAGESSASTLGGIAEDRDLAEALGSGAMYDGYDIMNAFAIITVVVAAIAVVAVIASIFVDKKIVKTIAGICGGLTAICAIIAIILTFVYLNNDFYALAKEAGVSVAPAIGAWLLAIGGVVCGVGCASVMRKAK